MGKPKKGGFPPPQPRVNYIEIKGGEISSVATIIAWGDSVVWNNKDAVPYTLAVCTNGQPDPQKVWATVAAHSSSAPVEFDWSPDMGKDPVVYEYGMLPPGTAKATITAQISRFE
jgi:hypothetical protein